jgi:hypothetical protein
MNEAVKAYRELNPTDTRSDKDITVWMATNYPGQYDGYAGFSESLAQIQRDEEAANLAARRADAPGLAEEANIGLARGIYGLESTLAGGLSLGAKMIGADDAAKEYLELARQKAEAAAAEGATIQKVEEISSVADAIRYIVGGAGEVVPSVAEALVTGVGGAVVGTATAPGPGSAGGFVAGIVGKQSAKKLLQKKVKDMVEGELKDQVEDELKQIAAGKIIASAASTKTKQLMKEEMRATAGRWSANAVVLANSQLLSSGEIYNELTENGIDPDKAIDTALVGGFIAAVPDSFLPSAIIGKAMPGVTNKAVKSALGEQIVKHASSLPASIGAEAATESFQELVNISALRFEQGGIDAVAQPLTADDLSRMKNAAALGAIGGGLAGGGSAVFQRLVSPAKEKEIDQAQEDLSKATTKAPRLTSARREEIRNLAQQSHRERTTDGVTAETQAKIDSLSPEEQQFHRAAESKVKTDLTEDEAFHETEEESKEAEVRLTEAAKNTGVAERLDQVRQAHPGMMQSIMDLLTDPRVTEEQRGRVTKDLKQRGVMTDEDIDLLEQEAQEILNAVYSPDNIQADLSEVPGVIEGLDDRPGRDVIRQDLRTGQVTREREVFRDKVDEAFGLAPPEGEVRLDDLAEPAAPLSASEARRQAFEQATSGEGAFFEFTEEEIDQMTGSQGDITGPDITDDAYMVDTVDQQGNFAGTLVMTGFATKEAAIEAFAGIAAEFGGEARIGAITKTNQQGVYAHRQTGKGAPGAPVGFDTPYAPAKRFKGLTQTEQEMFDARKEREGFKPGTEERTNLDLVQVSNNILSTVNWDESTYETVGIRTDPGALNKESWFRIEYDGSYSEEVGEIIAGSQSSVKDDQTATRRIVFFKFPDGSIRALGTRISKKPGANTERQAYVMSWPGTKEFKKKVQNSDVRGTGISLASAMLLHKIQPIASIKVYDPRNIDELVKVERRLAAVKTLIASTGGPNKEALKQEAKDLNAMKKVLTSSGWTRAEQAFLAEAVWTEEQFEDLVATKADKLLLDARNRTGEDAMDNSDPLTEQHDQTSNVVGDDPLDEVGETNPLAASDLVQQHAEFVEAIREVAPMEDIGGKSKVWGRRVKKGITIDAWDKIIEAFAADPDNKDILNWLRVRAIESLKVIDPDLMDRENARDIIEDYIRQVTYHGYKDGRYNEDRNIAEDWFERAEESFQREAFSIPGYKTAADGIREILTSGQLIVQSSEGVGGREPDVIIGGEPARGQGAEIMPGEVPPHMRDEWTTIIKDGQRLLIRIDDATPEQARKAKALANMDRDWRDLKRKKADTETWLRGSGDERNPKPGITKGRATRSKPATIKVKKDGTQIIVTRGGPDLTLLPEEAPIAHLLRNDIIGRTLYKSKEPEPMQASVERKVTAKATKQRARQKNREASYMLPEPASVHLVGMDEYLAGNITLGELQEANQPALYKEHGIEQIQGESVRALASGAITGGEFVRGNQENRTIVDLSTGKPRYSRGEIQQRRNELLNKRNIYAKPNADQLRYRRKILEQHGLDPAIVEQVDEIMEAGEQLGPPTPTTIKEGAPVEQEMDRRQELIEEQNPSMVATPTGPSVTVATSPMTAKEFLNQQIDDVKSNTLAEKVKNVVEVVKSNLAIPPGERGRGFKHRFSRPASMPDFNPEMREAWNELRGLLIDAGINVELLDLELDVEVAEMLGFYVDENGHPIEASLFDSAKMTMVQGMRDMASPTWENFRQLLHETGHYITLAMPENVQKMVLDAIDMLTDSELGITGSRDPGIVGDNTLKGRLLQEERLAEALSFHGIRSSVSKSWAAQIIRHVKNVMYRAAMWVQKQLLGQDHVAPDMALAFMKNRLDMFRGKPAPIFSFLGGKKLKPSDMASMYEPVRGGRWVDELYDWAKGEMTTDVMVPDDMVSTRHNFHSRGVYFNKTAGVAAPKIAGGDNATIHKLSEVAAFNNLNDSLEVLYYEFQQSGLNTEELDFKGFTKQLGFKETPAERIAKINDELTLNEHEAVPDGTSIDDLQDGELATMMLMKLLGKAHLRWVRMTSKAETNTPIIEARIERMEKRLDRLQKDYKDADLLWKETKSTLLGSVRQFTKDMRHFGDNVWAKSTLSRHLELFTQRDIELGDEDAVNKFLQSVSNGSESFTDFMLSVARLDLDWTKSAEDNIAAINSDARVAGKWANILKGDTLDSSILKALVSTFARSNPRALAWMSIRERQNAGEIKSEEAQALRAMLDAIKEESNQMEPHLEELVRQLASKSRAAGILAKEYQVHKANIAQLRKKADKLRKVTAQTQVIQDSFTRQLAQVEAELGAAMPVEMVEGAKLMVPPSEDASLLEVIDAPRFRFTRTKGRGRDRTLKQIRKILDVSERWLENNKDTQGKVWNTVHDTVQKLKLEEGENRHLAIKRSAWAQHMSSIVARLRLTGTDGGRRAATAINRYNAAVERYEVDAEIKGQQWEVARSQAWEKSGIADSERFNEHVYDRGLKFIESNKHLLQTESDPEEAVFALLKKHFATDAQLRTTLDEAWPAYRKMFEETRNINEWFDKKVRRDLGLKVKDDVLGILRETVGKPLFTTSRTLHRRMRSIYRDMAARGWSGTRKYTKGDVEIEEDVLPFEKPIVKKRDELATAFLEDPAALVEQMQSMLSGDIIEMFVEPMVNSTGRSLFKAPSFKDGVNNLATVDNTQQAWEEAGGDLVQFALNLYELEDGPGKYAAKETELTAQQDLAAFVGETLDTFHQYFAQIARIQIEQDNSIMQVEHGRSTTSLIPHQLMDARIAEDFPAQWLEYQRYDQSISRIIVNQMAIHAHLGRDMNEVNLNIRVAVDEMKKMSEEYQRLQRKVKDSRPDMDFNKPRHMREYRRLLNEAARERAKELGENPDSFLTKAESGFEGAGDAEKLVDSLHSWFQAQGSGLVELKAVMEVLNTMTGAIIQGPKTTILNFMSTFDPLVRFGASSVAAKQVGRNWKSMMGETFGSLFQMFGHQLNVNTENNLRRQRIGRKDSSLHVGIKDRMAAVNSQELSGGILQRGVVRAARLIRATLFNAGIGKAPEEGVEYAKFRPQAAFSTFVQIMNNSIIDGVWSSFEDMVNRGVEFMKDPKNLERISQDDFEFTAEDLGYKQRFFGDDKLAFERMRDGMAGYGLILENIVADAVKNEGSPVFTDEQYSMLASLATNEISLESSITNQPAFFMTNPFLRFSKPLLGWSLARLDELRRGMRDSKDQAYNFKAAMKMFAAIVPIGIAWTFLMDEYDEEVTGKKSDLRTFNPDDEWTGLALTFIERTARVGTFGIAGDIMNGMGNMAEGGDMRGISFDHRVVWMNALTNMMHSFTALSRTGLDNATYKEIWRPMMQAMGGGGYLQYAQILNNTVAPDLPFFRDEARVTRRINAQNYLRTIGRELQLDVRTGSGSRSLPNKIKPHVSEMILASLENNGTDFSMHMRRALQEAERDVRKKNPSMTALEVKGEAVSRVKMMYQSSHPLRIVFKTTPTANDYRNILNRLPDDGRRDVSEAVNLINVFGERYMDITPNMGKEEKGRGKRRRSAADFQSAAALLLEQE